MNKKLTRRRTALQIIAIGVIGLSSCGHPRVFNLENYTLAVKSGFRQIPESLQIESLFGEADHFISYSGPYVPQDWQTVVFFDRRYTLSMNVDVKTNRAFSEITEVIGEPKFILNEVCEVDVPPDGKGVGAEFSGDWKFSLTDWKKVYQANGDFSVIGIKIKKDQPVKSFDAYVNCQRAPRIQVRPD
jgi:hypothetical protein